MDGWRGGWVVVELDSGVFHGAGIFATAGEVVAAHGSAATVAADIPIGLPTSGRREADTLAQERLGRRRSTVFYCPPRDVLELDSYAEANTLSKQRHGFGISKQSYMLREKILEVDAVIGAGATIYEVHPEVAFRALVGKELASKRTYAGQRSREAALADVGIELPDDLGEAGGVPVDDVLDAAVVAYVAYRIATGVAESLPPRAPRDAHGRQMAIWF